MARFVAEPARGRVAWCALAILMCCVPLFVGLRGTDYEEDEAIYSYAVDRLVDTGDWLNPRSSPHENAIFVEKPPLKFWIVAAPIVAGLLPHDEFGMRFWDALFGAIAFLYVFAIGARTVGGLCGFTAVLSLFVYGPLLFEHGLRGNNMEAPLVLSYAGGIFHFLAWSDASDPIRRRWHSTGVGLYFLLGFLTKFVAALFLPLTLLAPVLLVPDLRAQFRRDVRTWLLVALGCVVVAAPWFVYQHLRAGPEFWQIILGEHVYRRFTASLDPSHVHSWTYYYRTIVGYFYRLGAVWLVGLGLFLIAVRAVRERWIPGVTLLSWVLLPLTLMSLGTSKLHHYAYPFLPPLALAGGYAVTSILALYQPLAAAVARMIRLEPPTSRRARQIRIALLALSQGALIVALATLVFGRVYWRIGDVTIFRNSDVYRPLFVAVALATLTARPRLPLLVLIIAPPLLAYRGTLERLTVERHPLRTMRDCLVGVNVQPDRSNQQRGVYVVEPERYLFHPYFYYLRSVGPLERGTGFDERAIVERLFGEHPAPVLIAKASYNALRATRQEPVGAVAKTAIGELLVLLPDGYATCGERGS